MTSLGSLNRSEVWKQAYKILEKSLFQNQLQMWIDPLEMRAISNHEQGYKIEILAPNELSANWVRDHFNREIHMALSEVLGAANCQVDFVLSDIAQGLVLKTGEVSSASTSTNPAASVSASTHSPAPPFAFSPTNDSNGTLDRRYTFDNFVVGSSNQFAHAAAVAVSEQPGELYNPLFIYSYPGLGKTHMMHAVGNHILATRKNSKVLYVSAEAFMNEYITSLKLKRIDEFRQKYRDTYDCILVDDIQYIVDRDAEKTSEEFFHTFNTIYLAKKQIVVTCDRPPKEMERLEDRIRSRFEMGLVASINPPDIETRIAILKTKSEQDNIYLPEDVCNYLAAHIKSNVRELEGVLTRLKAQSSLMGAEISLEMARQELKWAIPDEGSQYTFDAIQSAVAKHFHIKFSDFKSASRARNVALPRQIAMYLLKKYTQMTLKEIGEYFGGKDHTTVMHAIKKIESEYESNPEIREHVDAVQTLL